MIETIYKIFLRESAEKLKQIKHNIINHIAIKKYKNKLFSEKEIMPVVIKNRETLSLVHHWIENDVYENSLFNYGLPSDSRHLIDLPINNEVTYSDVICCLQSKIKYAINYLEVGVSVGKNFYQIANYVENSKLTGFDIENINPILERNFSDKKMIQQWKTCRSSIKKNEKSSLTTYKYKTNSVNYLAGDIFDKNSWEKLRGEKFTFLFSDAFHSPNALKFEYNMLKKYELINFDNFVMVWDDLGGAMTTAFLEIYDDMKKRYNLNKRSAALNWYRGWLGQYEPAHLVGVIFKT